ncbi:MAG: FAD-dependent oxidoreductase [bacterium]
MNNKLIFDLCIIGGGPAGVAAGVYSARKKIKTILITENFRNQSAVSKNIKNWIGTISISGEKLASNLEKHIKKYSDDIEIKEKEIVLELTDTKSRPQIDTDLMLTNADKFNPNTNNYEYFKIKTNKSEYLSKTILIASGRIKRKLEIKGAKKFEQKGITYCTTCDGPMFADMNVAVIGGGNSAFESAVQLSEYAKSVTIVQRSDFRADPIIIKKVLSNPKIKAVSNVDLIEIKGNKFVKSLIYKNKNTGEKTELLISGIFVEIGAEPSIKFLKNNLLKLNEKQEIIVNHKHQTTSKKGIWSAGDCADGLYKQNNIAVGDAIKALEDIYKFLKK